MGGVGVVALARSDKTGFPSLSLTGHHALRWHKVVGNTAQLSWSALWKRRTKERKSRWRRRTEESHSKTQKGVHGVAGRQVEKGRETGREGFAEDGTETRAGVMQQLSRAAGLVPLVPLRIVAQDGQGGGPICPWV